MQTVTILVNKTGLTIEYIDINGVLIDDLAQYINEWLEFWDDVTIKFETIEGRLEDIPLWLK